MLDLLQPIAEGCALGVPDHERLPIGVIGAGGIVDGAHLPAYAAAGLQVCAITDVDLPRAHDVAARHRIATVHPDVDALLADTQVAVVDIAVTPAAQVELAVRALRAGKHVLCQKPLSLTSEGAERVAAAAAASGRRAAVNQQLRFDEGLRALRLMKEQCWFGTPLSFTLNVNIATDWTTWPWMATSQQLDLWYHSVHYVDYVRALFGEPELVHCTGTRVPGQQALGETRTVSVMRFAGGAVAVLHVFHLNRVRDNHAEFRLDGDGGTARGTLGLLYDYPNGRVDTLEVNSSITGTDGWLPYPVTARWLPDAFIGPMASLLHAAHSDCEPETSVADNVRTIALVEALYRSMDSGDAQRLATV